ncbi:hypothetical protein CHUAL_006956 [Chamberlinius hualienensis]
MKNFIIVIYCLLLVTNLCVSNVKEIQFLNRNGEVIVQKSQSGKYDDAVEQTDAETTYRTILLGKAETDSAAASTSADNILNEKSTVYKRHCSCHKQSKIINVGLDIAGNIIQRDVGQCKSTCNLRHRFHNKKKLEQCNCVSSAVKAENIYLTEGNIKQVELVTECACVDKIMSCGRVSKIVSLFDDSPYTTKVDVGSCHGHCTTSETSCKPVRNQTITIEGPNGGVCVNSIMECACVGQCYRLKHFDVFTETVFNSTNNETVKLIKKIDIGRCVGHCDSSNSRQQCVFWDPKDNRKCLMSLTNRNSRCVPTSYISHIFNGANGQHKTVMSIGECSCT